MLVVRGNPRSSVKIEPVSLATQVALGHRTVVGGEHDADGLVLLSPASWRCALLNMSLAPHSRVIMTIGRIHLVANSKG